MGIEKNSVRNIEKIPDGADVVGYTLKTVEKVPPPAVNPVPETAVAGEKVAGVEKEDPQKKQLQEELRTLEAERAVAYEEYRKAQEKLRIFVSETTSARDKAEKSSEQDSIVAERDEARKRVFAIDSKKEELIRKLQENNQK
ncbi:MAG: hypothetical protein WCH07_09535 [Deltaproteobacteria bacterium]